jgi:hypothetical protein
MLKNANYFAMLAVIADRRCMRIAQPAPVISEPLTWEQICERYPDEWVCLVEIHWLHRSDFEFRTARVIGHGKSRAEPLVQALPWREQYRTIGHFHTAPLPPVAEPLLRFMRVDIPCFGGNVKVKPSRSTTVRVLRIAPPLLNRCCLGSSCSSASAGVTAG